MEALGKVVRFVQVVTVFAVVSFVLLLFVNEPQKPAAVPVQGTEDAGATLFATRCASCHGADGSGGFGPALAGVVTQLYPDPADEVAVVTNGRGSMPSFGDSLTPEQIQAVVEFTRTGLG
jgi:mono/diheme cytochrome c family protein